MWLFAKVAPLTTLNNEDKNDLASFIDATGSSGHLRVEQDFGGGYVRLRSSEAERRQAVQDIQSTEDILLELLRNARDAHAENIFVAVNRDKTKRTLVVIDDGCGIPPDMQKLVFEPRVTSKLDTSHLDKWGIHGRGMALYSISANASDAFVQQSLEGRGSSVVVETDLNKLPEKTDQSQFPHFEKKNGIYAMRGPKNILRTAAEFTLEHQNDCCVYCGSYTEIAATLYAYGLDSTTPEQRALSSFNEKLPLTKQLACSSDVNDFTQRALTLGLEMSDRSARRILNGSIKPLPTIKERIETESFPLKYAKQPGKKKQSNPAASRSLNISSTDIEELKHTVDSAFCDIADRYYLEQEPCDIKVGRQQIQITIPIQNLP